VAKLRNVLEFWRDTEFFTPFDLDAVVEFYDFVLPIHRNRPARLPWEQLSLFPLDPEREYTYDFFYAPFPKSEVLRLLEIVLPEIRHEVFYEPRDYAGLSALHSNSRATNRCHPSSMPIFQRPKSGHRLNLFDEGSRSHLSGASTARTVPLGRWLEDPERVLSFNQQFALHCELSGMIPITAVNGPTGTGKTTLVKDLVATLVVQRAQALDLWRLLFMITPVVSTTLA